MSENKNKNRIFKEREKMEQILTKSAPFFNVVMVLLVVLVLWHAFYVFEAYRATGHSFLVRSYLVFALGGVMLAALVGITSLNRMYQKTGIWLLAFLMLGFISLRVMPGLSAPDEPTHYITAYYYSNFLTFETPEDEEGHVYIRAKDFPLEDLDDEIDDVKAGIADSTRIFGQEMDEETYYISQNWKKLYGTADGGRVVSYQPRMESSPVVYLPQAVGIAIAKSLNMGADWLVRLGRLFNMLAFALIVFWAILRTPVGKEAFMAVSLLPMTVHLAASMSYDAMLIALVFAYSAEVLYLAKGEEKAGWKDIAILAGLLACFGSCKMVYGVSSLLLLLLIPKEKFAQPKLRAILWAAGILAVAASLYLVNAKTIGTFAAGTEADIVCDGEPGYTIGYSIRHPMDTAKMLYNTLCYQGDYYFITLNGGYLGNADPTLDVPFLLLLVLSACVVILSLNNADDLEAVSHGLAADITGKDKWIIGIFTVIITGALMLCMLVGWTPLSSNVILGIQGRYLLPVLPVSLLLCKNRTLVLTKDLRDECLFLMVAADVFAFLRLYSMISLHI